PIRIEAPRGRMHSRNTLVIGSVNVGAGLYQATQALLEPAAEGKIPRPLVAAVARHDERGVVSYSARVDAGAALDQPFDCVEVRLASSHHQRRHAFIGLFVDVRARVEQSRHTVSAR